MGKFSSQTASVAWFKLHEFVQRREKERALGIYKLLVHSIADQAVAAQLMGDLLGMFDDPDSFSWYTKAARIYQENGRYDLVISLYRYMLSVDSSCDHYYRGLIGVYAVCDEKMLLVAIQEYVSALIAQKRTLDAHEYIKRAPCSNEQRVALHEFFVALLLDVFPGREKICVQSHVAAAIEAVHKSGACVDDFCLRLEDLDTDVYNFAKQYVESMGVSY